MVSPCCRLLPFAHADGPTNMAGDEAMLEAAHAGLASLRFYGWDDATLSLGYFQSAAIQNADARLAALPMVRRPSGGMALVHHHELTYALALPEGAPWQSAAAPSWLCRMHGLIVAALTNWSIVPRAADCATHQHPDSVLCFQHVTPGDVCLDNFKVAGSAQRRQHGALLQHGAVLLKASPAAPQLPGITDLCGTLLPLAELADAIGNAWVRQTGWALTPTEWGPGERSRRAELVQRKYSQTAWTRKR